MMKSRLLQRIGQAGPIPFDEFMTSALYDPDDGYFATGPLRSTRSGDFLTSPEVSPLFGETLAVFVERELTRVGGTTVVEIGGGSGSLLRPLLDAVDRHLDVWAVEASHAARSAIRDSVPEASVVETLFDLPLEISGVVVANEVADNIPVALAVRRGGGWVERWVDADHGELVLVDAQARPEIVQWCDRHAGRVPEGGQVEAQVLAGEWFGSILQRVTSGAVVIIDYGDDSHGLEARRATGTLRTYQGHHLGPNPLVDPGGTDITVDVAFDALESVAVAAGFRASVTTQREFLADLGLQQRRDRMRADELELARSGDVWKRLQAKSRVTEADTLLHPRGLGDFRVLVAQR